MSAPIPFVSSGREAVAGFDPDEYHAFGKTDKERIRAGDLEGFVMSRSTLWAFAKHPSKWIRTTEEKETTKAMDWGTLLDNRVLMPERFATKFVRRPATYPVEIKAGPKKGMVEEKPFNLNSTWCSDWEEAAIASGKIPVSAKDWEESGLALARLNEEPGLAELLARAQKSVFLLVNYHDAATGIVLPFKVLLDVLPDSGGPDGDVELDLKSDHSAEEVKWTRHVFDQGYHYQGAAYLDATNVAIPSVRPRTSFGHIISESSPPYEPALRMLSEEFLALGRGQVTRDLALFCKCVATRHWPGYQEAGTRLRMGRWSLTEPTPWMQNAAHMATFVQPKVSGEGKAVEPMPEDDISV